MATTEYLMPKLAMAMNEGTVTEWLVESGQKIEKGSPIATVETEKVVYDLESPHSGFFKIQIPAGETVPVERVIGYFADSEAELAALTLNNKEAGAEPAATEAVIEVGGPQQVAPSAPASAQAARVIDVMPRTPGERIKASPLARKMAAEKGLALALIEGSGPGGRIVKRDVLKALERGERLPLELPSGALRERARIPMQGMRATIANRMLQSQQSTASLSSGWESDVTELLRVRQAFVVRAEQLGTKVSVNAFIIKAIACAVKQVPIANSALVGDEIVIYDNINMGIAIALPGQAEHDSTLMVPVLMNVDRMGVVEIDRKMKALIERARNRELSTADMSNSTITLSSTAGIAPPGLTTSPVLNLPNAVIVGPSTPKEKPVVVDGEIVVRTLMPLSMTFDHRILDGEPAARFMKHLHDYLENPELMLG